METRLIMAQQGFNTGETVSHTWGHTKQGKDEDNLNMVNIYLYLDQPLLYIM